MFQEEGMWWPPMPSDPSLPRLYLASAEDMTLAMSHIKQFNVAVQAGGHCGEWALWLAERFGAVYTFEPDALNFNCLTRNVAKKPNIFAARGFLANERGPIDLERSFFPSLGGTHHGRHVAGSIPVYRVDDFSLPACDALILDVEGMELPALQGAEQTIRRFRPVIQLENNPEWDAHGWGDYSRIMAFLNDYIEVGRVGYHDVVLAPR